MKSFFCILVVIASLASIGAPPTNTAGGLADQLHQLVALVGQGFEDIALTLTALKESQELDHETLQRVIQLQEQLETRHNESHASLQSQISVIVDSLDNSMPAFDNLNASLAKLEALVPPPTCPSSWQKFEDHCYKFVAIPSGVSKSVDTALAECGSLGANLTAIRSAAHETFLLNGLSATWLIVGGNDRDIEGTWVWPDGDLVNNGYTNWYPGQPNGDDCMFVHYDGKWYDLSCTVYWGSGVGYVCEKLLG